MLFSVGFKEEMEVVEGLKTLNGGLLRLSRFEGETEGKLRRWLWMGANGGSLKR